MRQFFSLTEATSLWKKRFEGVLYKPPYQQAKLKSTPFAFYYSMLLSLSGSLNQASMQTFQELEELF